MSDEQNTIVVLIEGGRVIDVWSKSQCTVITLNADEAEAGTLRPVVDFMSRSYAVETYSMGPLKDSKHPTRPLAVGFVESLVSTGSNVKSGGLHACH
ncbi:hypothetical protein KBW71_08050 [Hydrogenophaga aromaticivorans]|uniref:hypothetical protein n=1 Tax=Hydrogenophaga aromaticivorans TaxID=2610898 RepID=UPI001B359BE7|nr:hypothetical protein [Hydrogenophaga aromaticivorans]MBQ0918394.1 hypothetical protein [Hydrogenophaga aromaticivorans]